MRRLACAFVCLLVSSAPGWAQAVAPAPLLVQGAMVSETDHLIERLQGAVVENVAGWQFWRGTIDGYPVVISRTNKGMSNAAAATALGIEHFHPAAIINQGTAGGHDPALHVYDIVLGTASLNVGAFRAMFRKAGDGSRPLEWVPLNLLLDGSAVSQTTPKLPARFEADPSLLALARATRAAYTRGRVVDGIIGSSDMWIDELDRVAQFHQVFGTSVEEMETASAAQVAQSFQVPFMGIRVLSDNITNESAYDPKAGGACQDFVADIVRAWVSAHARQPGVNAR